MAKLIYSMLVSLDGYTEDEHGDFGWGAPEDEEVHSYINELASSFGTYLYGRRMYETMVYWETAHTVRDQPQFVLDWARQWQAAEKSAIAHSTRERMSISETRVRWTGHFSAISSSFERCSWVSRPANSRSLSMRSSIPSLVSQSAQSAA